MGIGFLPWWLGAAALAGVTVFACVLVRRPLGVSGILGRAVRLRAELDAERARRAAAANEAALEAALLAETLAQFGPGEHDGEAANDAPAAPSFVAPDAPACAASAPPPPLLAQLGFLLAIACGAGAYQLARGSWALSGLPGGIHAELFGAGLPGLAVLFGGGLLVGAGTSLAGGCSTGHGLSGCSRLQPGSLVASATFFGTAVLTALFVAWVRR